MSTAATCCASTPASQLSKTFGTIFIERIFDLIAIVVLGLAAGFWSFRSGMSKEVRIIFAVGLVVVVVLVVGLFVVRNFGRRILTRLPVPHRVVDLYDQFEEGLFSVDRRSLCPSWSRPSSSGPPRRCGVLRDPGHGLPGRDHGHQRRFFVALIASC